MYERNAIVLERYFDHLFGYDIKNNLKTNFKEYTELVKSLEEYKEISEEEDSVVQEYDRIANNIRQIQNFQETLEQKNKKVQEEREDIFKSIDENPDVMEKKLEKINEVINNINNEVRENSKKYVDIISEFNEKSAIRTACERNRRKIESEYNKILNSILDDYKDIGIDYVRKSKQFIEEDTEKIEEELLSKIEKNGEKEKIPFNKEVITKAIALSIDIQKRETDILTNIYDKTNKIFMEIKNNNIKIEKHKKTINDSNCKMSFISAIKDYLVLFLDNERLTVVNGEEEHTKLMKEACKNIEEDLVQINNLYTLLMKEMTNKITKKSYEDLYNIEYINNLENKANQFDLEVRKLKLPVTVINPNYWRIEGMKKIYDVFLNAVTEVYGRDLSEYIKKDIIEDEKGFDEPIETIYEDEDEEENKGNNETIEQENDLDTTKSEIDRKIDMILGFDEEGDITDIDEDDWDEDDFEDENKFGLDEDENIDEEDEEDDDEKRFDEEEEIEDNEYDEFDYEEDANNDFDEYEEDEEDSNFEEDDEDEDDEDEDEDEDESSYEYKNRKNKKELDKNEDVTFDIWGNKVKQNKKYNSKKGKHSKENNKKQNKKNEDNWENEYIKIDKKDKKKKKKGFFEKFMK